MYLKKREQTFPGGYKIVEPLIYGNISGVTSYSLYDQVYTTPVFPSVQPNLYLKHQAPIIISKDEELQNSGETQVLQLLKSKIQIVEETLKATVTSALATVLVMVVKTSRV